MSKIKLLTSLLMAFIFISSHAYAQFGNHTPIVIVHGAWGGAHDWREVERNLNSLGYEVRRVSLTGQGERSHLANPVISFNTHVNDVINLVAMEYNTDEKIIIVGHSYGGHVITSAANSIPNKIEKIIYIDAYITQSSDLDSDFYVKDFGFSGEITPTHYAIPPSWETYWSEPNSKGPKDVPHLAKTLQFPKELFQNQHEVAKIKGAYALFTEGLDMNTPLEKQEFWQKASYEKAIELGYFIQEKPWSHNAHRTDAKVFTSMLVELINNAS